MASPSRRCTSATWTPTWPAVPADQKVAAADVAAQALDGIETGLPEILADETSRYVKQSLSAAPLPNAG